MLKRKLSRVLTNFNGWSTNRKIVVFESDDWGSIRMPSKEVYEKCLKSGYPVDKIAYERYDTILSEDDLELLFDLLHSFKDKEGNPPVITANCVVANPDFERIKADNYNKYHFELITETFKRYPMHSNCFSLWKKGIEEKIIHLQYHCREHLNVSLFMDALRKRNNDVLYGFALQMPGCISMGPEIRGNEYMEATKYNSLTDKEEKLDFFLDGLDLFEKLFGYRSESIIPPNYTWSNDYNQSVGQKGVRYFQGLRKMTEPNPEGKSMTHAYYLGMENQYGQTYLVRNATFEPALFRLGIKDPVHSCLSDIAIAFQMHKPVIISSHRINYAGFIDEANRDRTLKLLRQLLASILKRWPDIEFMTSVQLGHLINS